MSPRDPNYHQTTGAHGERLAAEYLRKNGYEIVASNYRTRLGEIDIIAAKEGAVFFVEVKTRKTDTYGAPEESIGYKKIQSMVRIAEQYIARSNSSHRAWSLMVCAIELSSHGEVHRIELIPIES